MLFRPLLVCLAALTLALPAPVRAQDPVYDTVGAQYGRGFFAPLPWERIDIVTGNVFHSFTDLSLPGNAGLDLSVVRTYNSRDGRWRIGLAGVPLRVVFNSGLSDVDFITADGAKHNATGGAATTLTMGFWRFTKATRKLEMPNGLVLTYGHEPSGAGAYLTEIRDAFDNVITLTWQGTQLLSAVQPLGPGQTRTVHFANWADDMATSVTFGSRTVTYTWETIGGSPTVQALTAVAVSGGINWSFSYVHDGAGAVKMQTYTTPNGGTVTYTWGLQSFPTTPSQRYVIVQRTTGGRAPYAAWDFNWQGQGRVLEIIGPTNVVLYETVVVNDIPVKTQRSVRGAGSAFLEVETLTYETLPHPVSPVPGVKTVTVERDGETYTTTYTYASNDWANYGQPTQIVEVGGYTRTTNVTYEHNFSPYIRGRVASTTTTVNGQASTRSFAYNGATGFLTSATELGVTTTYGASATGNVAWVKDAANVQTNFLYEWGVARHSSSPASTVAVTRGLNADGSVAWEESTGTARTSYTYDAAGRVATVSSDTPGRVPVTTGYTNNGQGRWVSTTVTRGTVWATTTIDGFGRPTHTVDSAGVQTSTGYNAAGQVTYQSRPFGGGVSEIGDTFGYDALGRSTGVSRPDGSYVTYFYLWSNITVQESTGPGTYRNTGQYYHRASAADPGRLWRLVDPALGDWRYDYNGRGQLTGVGKLNDATVPLRTWSYTASGWLASVTQPESGTTTYGHDAVGNVTQMTNALGTTLYTLNGDYQPLTVNAPGTADDVAYTYDTAGRVSTIANPTAQTTFTYDTSSRVKTRTDVITGRTFVQTFDYDGYDNLVQVTYPLTGRKVFYDYNAQQRLTAVRTQISTGPVTTLAGSFVYRGDGSLASYQFGNGQSASVTPDNRRRPEDWVNGPLSVSYTYDHVSNIKTITDPRPGMSQQFTYDALDRLTTVTGFGATSYTYTPGGDRLTAGTVNFHYAVGTRRLTSLSGTEGGTFSYNDFGSLTSDPSGAAYTYTALNMLKTATPLGGQATTYQYGGDGMRAVKTGPDGVPRLYVYGAGGGPIGEYKVVGGTVQIEREYVYLGSQLLASFAPSPITPPPLSVAMVTPTQSQHVPVGQTIQLTAAASVGGGLTIARVEYYNGGQFIGQAATAPYTVPFTNGGNGTLPPTVVLRARVVATNGQAAASAPVTITIQQ